MSHRVLVTGSEGFVGRQLRTYLADQGYEVRGCDVLVPPNDTTQFTCNIQDAREVEALLEWCGTAEYVVHLAAVSFVPEAGRSPARVMEINIGGTIHLVEAMLRRWPEARLLFVSSSEVYGPPESLPITECHPMRPQNPYAISKAAAEQFCLYAHRHRGLDTTVLRPFNHSGPGQQDRFALSSFARQIAVIEEGSAEPVLRVGNLNVSRDFMHVHDVVRAYESALRDTVPGEVYNLCSGVSHSLHGAVEELVRLSHVNIGIEVAAERTRGEETPEIRGSYDKFNEATGWEPALSFGQLLADLLDYWRAQSRQH